MSSNTALATQPARTGAARSIAPTTIVLFAFTSFLSAFLLFQVQLIVSKYILPWFGGSAAVWTTSMLVFQVLLLAGYIYSHVISVRFLPPLQTKVHIGLLAAAFIVVAGLSLRWPSAVTPGPWWKPLQSGSPGRDVAIIILAAAGLPFLVLSTTGPLLQAWFAGLGGGARAYKLYSVSNLGSLLGLLTFPFLFEPALRLTRQGGLWSMLFYLFVGACGVCAWQALKQGGSAAETQEQTAEATPPDAAPRPVAYALWFLLAGSASALLLATTNMLCQEVITVPLLWVLPLAIYLFSFILCFDHPRWYKRAIFHPLFVVSLLLTCGAMVVTNFPVQVIAVPVLLFATCMVCHGELVRLKPGVKYLTKFYLAISAGGAAGGIFVGIIAPRVFTAFVEFQLSLALALILVLFTLVLDGKSWLFRRDYWLPAAIAAGALLAAFGAGQLIPAVSGLLDQIRYYPLVLLLATLAILGAVVMRGPDDEKRGFRFVQILVGALALFSLAALYASAQPQPGLLLSSRSFYGVVKVQRQSGWKEMVHGQTIHGGQLDPPNDRFPTMYFGPNSGVGVVLRNHPKRNIFPGALRIGVVGLGAGTLAAYGRTGDSIRYYEINPDVVRLSAGERPVFTYVRDSAARISVALGDARLVLEQEAARGERHNFDVLVLDAFSGDSIPVHLLTKEAFETYWQQLDPETGLIAVHITSRHVNLVPVLQGASAYFKAEHVITYNRRQGAVFDSGWVLISRRPGLLKIPGLEPITVQYVHKVGPRLWTDDYSDIFRLIY